MFIITRYDRESGKIISQYNIFNVDTRQEMARHLIAQNKEDFFNLRLLKNSFAVECSKTIIFVEREGK